MEQRTATIRKAGYGMRDHRCGFRESPGLFVDVDTDIGGSILLCLFGTAADQVFLDSGVWSVENLVGMRCTVTAESDRYLWRFGKIIKPADPTEYNNGECSPSNFENGTYPAECDEISIVGTGQFTVLRRWIRAISGIPHTVQLLVIQAEGHHQ